VRLVVLLGMLAGCDRVFQLSHVRETDAHPDGPADVAGDTAGSATPCWDSTRTGDDDGDGIPDICDPESGPNTIAAFLPLHDLNNWAAGLGTWAATPSDIVETSTPATYALLEYGTAVATNAWVQLRVIGPDTPSTADTAVAVYLDTVGSKDLTQGISCSVSLSSQGLGRGLVGSSWSGGSSSSSQLVPFGNASTTEAWIYVRTNPVGCMADFGTGLRVAAPPPSGINRQPQIALTTGASTGQFESITVFSSVAH